MAESAELLQAVAEAARLGGSRALECARSVMAYESKQDGSPVTVVDRDVETRLREWIMRRFPDDGILGEEFPEHRPGAKRRWIIDPIDGTQSYIRGVPLWGTMVAVARGDEVLAGAIDCAGIGELACAAAGEGCWWNDSRCHVSAVAELSQAAILATDERNFRGALAEPWKRLGDSARVVRGWSDCYAFILVASGRAEAVVEPSMALWDAAAPFIIVREAGGVATDFAGKETALGGNLIATNKALAADVRAIITPRRSA
jgi:histidinol-phosphatase